MVSIQNFMLGILGLILVSQSAAQAAEAEKIRFCRPSSDMLAAHAIIAEHNGYFKENGIDPEIKKVSFGKICQDDLLAENPISPSTPMRRSFTRAFGIIPLSSSRRRSAMR